MVLLKIGTLNIPRDRWVDALDCFSEVYVFCYDTEKQIEDSKIHYIPFPTRKFLNRKLGALVGILERYPSLSWLCEVFLLALRVCNRPLLRKIHSVKYDAIHSSYNDSDESALLTAILNPRSYTRAQKETRLRYSYLEERAFRKASRVILNDELNLELYRKKYGQDFLENAQIIYQLDEDVRSRKVFGAFPYAQKLSEKDGKIHAVILAGRVLSDPNEPRSGGRLYYINLINELIDAGMIVHLHTGRIVPCNGADLYQELAQKREEFVIEGPLDFDGHKMEAYHILSRYDIGVCHEHIPNTEVTTFDKVNIPHRYYEYHIAHVAPFDMKGGNLLLEKKAKHNHALICNSFSEITMDCIKEIEWESNTFSQYIQNIYG